MVSNRFACILFTVHICMTKVLFVVQNLMIKGFLKKLADISINGPQTKKIIPQKVLVQKQNFVFMPSLTRKCGGGWMVLHIVVVVAKVEVVDLNNGKVLYQWNTVYLN